MSLEDNKKLVQSWFDAVNRGDSDAIYKMLAEDFHFRSMYVSPPHMRIEWGKEEFATASGNMSAQMKKPIALKVTSMIAEGDSVAAEAESHGEMLDGNVYNNLYHFLFEIKKGKISKVREYSCSYHAWEFFGKDHE